MNFAETDWKRLRALHDVALNRYCAQIIEECAAIIADSAASPHERYLRLYRVIAERDSIIRTVFDDLRRSTALQPLISIVALHLVTPDELTEFTQQTRDTVMEATELARSPKPKRVRHVR
jgi:hypothetical protein